MDDRRRRAVTPPRFNSVVASATVMAARPTSLRKANPAQAWWEDAWAFYDSNGELRFAVGWIANGLSRLNLLAARRPPLLGDDPAPLAGTSDIEKAANALVSDIAGGPDGQSQMLARLATLLTVTGLGWVLIESTSRGGVDGTWSWRVLSNDELRADRGEYEVEDVESPDVSPEGWRKLHRNHVLIKIWRSHARRSSQPDSSCRGALRPLRQLALLDDHIEATAQSRLAGAGLLILPNEVEFSPIAREADPDDPDADGASTDDFTEVMIDTMTTPIYDRGIAAAVVPLAIKVPGEYVDKVKHITFWSEFSDTVLALGERAIKRLALALDMPPEVVTGVSGMNHWGAWRVQEEAITLHIEPLALIICHALTKGYLRPALLAMDFDEEEVGQLLMDVDATNLTVRPDLSDDTIAAWDRLEVSSATLRRELGLSESDKPSEDEFRQRLILRVIDRSPQLASVLLPELGVDVPAPVENEQSFPITPTETTPGRQLGGPPDQVAAAVAPALVAAAAADSRLSAPALVAACDGIVYRALERAGARLRNRAGRHDGLAAADVVCDDVAELHTHLDVSSFASVNQLLEDVWGRVPAIAERYGVDPDVLLAAVDAYTRGLLVNGEKHTIDRLADALPLGAVAA
jgi:hypothetical protein